MRILYVTPLWSGLRDILLEGSETAKGMPAFINPLKRLVELGNEVEIIVVDPGISKKSLNIRAEWLKQIRIRVFDWEIKGYKKAVSLVKLCLVVYKTMKSKQYDFIYGHGSIGSVANMIANLNGVPCGIRLYGTFLASEINRISRIQIAMRHPLEYLAFKLSKDFLLITNDGTKGDQVYNYLTNNTANYKFYFMLNGVNLPEPISLDKISMEQIKSPFVVYPARIARWKRQDIAIDILSELHSNGLPVNLYLVGHITDTSYWNEIQDKITTYKLTNFVTYLGTVEPIVLQYLYKKAMVVFSLYKYSNLGNVVIEALSAGAVVISFNDGSLDSIIDSGQNGILVDNETDAVSQVLSIYENDRISSEIRASAIRMASEMFKDWVTRAEEEIQLIENAVLKNE